MVPLSQYRCIEVGHARGTPETMQGAPHYDSVIDEVAAELRASIAVAREAGIVDGRLVIDPGIGFGKRPEDSDLAEMDALWDQAKEEERAESGMPRD